MRKVVSIFLIAALFVLAVSGCRQNPSSPEPASTATQGMEAGEDDRLRVMTTIFPPYDFVRQIAGDRVELSMLLSPGSESHSYDPTPQDIIAIQSCDVFLYVGGETDIWVERILESMDTSSIALLPLMDMVEVVEEEIVEGMEAGHSHEESDDHDHDHDGDEDDDHRHDHEEDDDHQEPELDEHVWTAPRNAAIIAGQIADTLMELDPAGARHYDANREQFQNALDALDRQYEEAMAQASRRTVIFGDRFPFRYLADAYGLDYYAAFPGCSTETEASAATVAFLIDKVREESIPVVFHIELSNEKMADAICESTGAEKRLLHSCHNVTRDDFLAGVTYLDLMEQNLTHLKEALA